MMIRNKEELRDLYRGITHLPDYMLLEWTNRLASGVAKGDELLSTHILNDFILRVVMEQPQSQVTLQWLADALNKIMGSEDPRSVLRLPKRPRNRPPGESVGKWIRVVFWIKLAVDRGYSDREANEKAADLFGCDVTSIRRMRKACSEWAASMNPDPEYWEEQFARLQRPLPPQKSQDRKS